MVKRTAEEVSCALRARREKGQFNTLGESGRVAGGRVEALYFLLTFAMCCVVPFTVSKSKSSHEDAGQDRGKFDSGSQRGGDPCIFSHRLSAERVEPFAEGLALSVELDRRRPRRLHGIRLRRLRGFRLRRPHGALLRRPHGALLRRPHGFRLRRPRGALDMLHRNEEHALKSLHVD